MADQAVLKIAGRTDGVDGKTLVRVKLGSFGEFEIQATDAQLFAAREKFGALFVGADIFRFTPATVESLQEQLNARMGKCAKRTKVLLNEAQRVKLGDYGHEPELAADEGCWFLTLTPIELLSLGATLDDANYDFAAARAVEGRPEEVDIRHLEPRC
jgi:hypothetical protein